MNSTYVILERLEVQDANCIAGFTYGFPAIMHFLGFVHALSRKLFNIHQLQLQGCAVICHQHQIHAYQPKSHGNYVFAQSKNPPIFKNQAKKTASIIEEGKMNMSVSLIMECPAFNLSRQVDISALKQTIIALAYQHRLAGGSIQRIKSVQIFKEVTDHEDSKLMQKIKCLLLPGFVLMDRADLLAEHYQRLKQNHADAELIDAWLDFSAMKYKAEPRLKEAELEPTDDTKAEWIRLDKPSNGYLVPIANGYKAISKVYPPGEVANTRNSSYQFCFVETSHSVGEWRSLHRIQHVPDIIWQYRQQEDWYLCQQGKITNESVNLMTESAYDEFEDDFLSSL